MAEKVTLEALRDDIKQDFSEVRKEMRTGFSVVQKDIQTIRKDVQTIHEDLVKHDERAEKMMEMLQRLLVIDELKTKVSRIRDFLRDKHGVEI